MLKTKIVSSLEKAFIDDRIEKFAPLECVSVLRGERLSLQLLHTYDNAASPNLPGGRARIPVKLEGELAKHASLRQVMQVPVTCPTNPTGTDDNYLKTTPGLYPDILRPLYYGGCATVTARALGSVWIEINIPEDMNSGVYELKVSLSDETAGTAECRIKIEVIAAALPKDDIYFTQWFHADCLANYYNVEVWSDRHWQIVENFARTAIRNGINLLLTPVFTPPLDTAVGGERRTTQLVDVYKNGDEYSFGFEKLDRWVDMCDRCGIEYLEISHFFTQWGAAHAPKIMVTVDGEYKKLFGWHTEATGEEYKTFIRSFIKAFLSHMKARGDDKRCFFHVSDEPGLDHLESYRAAKETISDLLDGYFMMDALSKYDFYKLGIVEHPVCSNNHIEPFLEAGVKDLWTYYCVSQNLKVSNRYVSMPSWRTRSIGMQIYKYDIKGFLHWGYNFYNDQFSADPINPYYEQCADHGFPAGDSFSVYPAMDGTALESMRIIVFYEALQDIKAMKLCERYYGHEATVAAIESVFGKNITFDTCTKSSEMTLAIREKINSMIKNAIE